MANVKDLIVNGAARIVGKVYSPEFVGNATSATNDSNGNKITSTYLPLSGGAMTGNISYKGPKSTGVMIKFIGNTTGADGNGICIGGGGATIIGSGESAEAVRSGLSVGGGDEKMYIASDETIIFYTNCQSGIGSAKRITMDTSGVFTAPTVKGAVFNDLADAIPVGEGDVLEAGYCYGFDGEHYTKTSEYMQKSYIGIHSDTFGFLMGHEEGKEKLNVAVSGFVLAYVDKEYEVGTPLTCTTDGYLTEIKFEDKMKYPERIVATYWKNEPNEEWGSKDKKVRVEGRRWVKVK